MITAKQLRKSYGDLTVLKGVDLSIQKGEVVAITGPSGAGKTTLLQILGTLSSPDKTPTTTLMIDQSEILGLKDRDLARFRNESLGFVFQFHELLDEFTALENVMMPALIQGKKKAAVKDKAMGLLQRLGVDHRIDHKPNTLSGGEQQRIAVARALMNDPAIIFADEPSGNLDSKNADALHQLFFDLRDELKQTFVIVTHNKTLANMADRTIHLVDGAIVA
ncbi:MAG: ABC transporter ATP-binding protein [Flavobacteriaceae bacterium]|nr:ABC transporter ATP-binding protein [Flavobacteriaceae bacterium]